MKSYICIYAALLLSVNFAWGMEKKERKTRKYPCRCVGSLEDDWKGYHIEGYHKAYTVAILKDENGEISIKTKPSINVSEPSSLTDRKELLVRHLKKVGAFFETLLKEKPYKILYAKMDTNIEPETDGKFKYSFDVKFSVELEPIEQEKHQDNKTE